MQEWEQQFKNFLLLQQFDDASHGLSHIQRVVVAAKRIGKMEQANPLIVIPAAWLHDCVAVEKSSPLRSKASTLAAEKAVLYLKENNYPNEYLEDIYHAIQAHSFSANIDTQSLEAKVVQDADRLDALGAIGLARCLMVGERLGLQIYDTKDPFCRTRTADDRQFVIDHFYVKLLKLPQTMKTTGGRQEAQKRADFLRLFLRQLEQELLFEDP